MPQIVIGICTLACAAITLVNLAILGLSFKLYTEFAKQRMQELRKS